MSDPLRATVPAMLRELVGEVPGVHLQEWDLDREPEHAAEIAFVLVPPFAPPGVDRLADLPALRVVQLASAGYDHALAFRPPGVALCNAVGVHDTATAELALTLTLAAQRRVPEAVRAQRESQWRYPDELARGLADHRVLVVGYGGIGRALTRRLLAGEAQVVAVANRARPGDEQVDQVHGVDTLDSLLPTCDVVALTVPYRESTRHLLDARRLALLPDDALVVKVARGGVLHTDALVAECATGRLRAALDVTDPEPLPAGHPLWTTQGVLLTPHVGGSSRAFPPRLAALVRRQLSALASGADVAHVVATG